MNVSTKRLLSILLSLAMVLALLPLAVFAETPTTLYVKPNSNWNIDGARFAAYFFGAGETWADCTDADGDGIYEVTIPEGGYTHIIFCRMNPNAAANNWNNKWNQTKDLPLADTSADKNCYVVADNSWDNGNGEWVAYSPDTGAEETEPTTASPIEYSVAGVAGLCGSAWDPSDINNMMLDEDGDGVYSITYAAVAAGTYQFKVTDGTWSNSWGGSAADGNYEIVVVAEADVTINFNSLDKTIEVVSDGIEAPAEPEPTEPPVTEPFVPGVREYALVGYINGADYGCNDDYENVGEYIFVDGTLSTSFTADSYVFLKTTDNANWFLTETYAAASPATFVAGGSEKLFVPGNVEVTFTLVENEDGSVTVSYVTGEPVEPPVTEPTEPSESEPVIDVVYYVAGSFNGWTNPDENYVMTQNEDGTFSITFAVTAGEIELKVTDGSWDNCWGNNGDNVKVNAVTDGSITVNFNATSGSVVVTGDCLGEVVEPEEPEMLTITSMHVAGDEGLTGANWDTAANQMDCAMGIYFITFENVAAGTYQFKFVANGTWDLNWASGIEIASGEAQTAWFNAMGNSSITVAEDGSAVTLAFDMTTMDMFTGEGATMSAEIAVPQAPAAGELVIGDNALTLEANDQDGESWTFVPAEDGTLFLNVTALSYDWMGEGNYEEAPADQISMGWSRMYTLLVNNEAYYMLPVAVEVSAGTPVTVQIIANYGYATNLTLALSMGAVVEPEPAEPGTMGNPIVIETLPYEISVDGEHDLYYIYTAEADGVITVSAPEGNLVSNLPNYTKIDGIYYCTVTAGDEISINPWGSNAGTYTIAYGEAPEIENVNIYFDASLYGWANVNAYAWDADGNPVSAEWPGSAMTLNEDGIWTIELPGNAMFVLFNNGEYYQTSDKDFYAENLYNGMTNAVYGSELVTNFYITGDGVFGEWDPANEAGIMTNNGNGIFTGTINNVEAGTYGIKVTDGTWVNSFGEWGENVIVEITELSNVTVTFNLNEQTVTYEAVPVVVEEPVVIPTLTLKAPTLEFKDMITVNAMFEATNLDDVVEMGMITYTEKVDEWSVETANHVIPGTTYDVNTGRYIACSQGIHAKYLGDTVYLACYAKLTDGSYVYSKLAGYSPVQYATGKLKGDDVPLKQLVVAMLNYGAAAQLHFGHNVENLANATLTAEQIALPEAYRSDMVSTVASPDASKQGEFVNNKGFAKRYPSISFEGAFCINYFFTPNYAPVDGITLYYWNAADFEAVDVLTVENASGSFKLDGEGTAEYRGDIVGIAAKALGEGVYVAAVYSDGANTWTSGVLGYSIGAYCSSQATKGGTIADLAMATAVYGYQAKVYFG